MKEGYSMINCSHIFQKKTDLKVMGAAMRASLSISWSARTSSERSCEKKRGDNFFTASARLIPPAMSRNCCCY